MNGAHRFAAAVLSLALAGGARAAAQETAPAATADWPKEVERACTHARYGLRLAAARKVAAGGAAAVPAIRAFAAARGGDAIPVAVVETIADAGSDEAAVLELLRDWAGDRMFFWRAQALKGLARRAGGAATADLGRFEAGLADPAWLVRAFAAWGLARAGRDGGVGALLRDEDPRARTRLAALLLQDGRDDGFEELVAALGDERTFLGDPWGRRRAQEALAALKQRFGTDHGYRADAGFDQNRAAIEAWHRATPRHGAAAPPRLGDPEQPFAGGIAVLSCQRGDLFVRWTADGRIQSGLGDDRERPLPAAVWQPLAAAAADLQMQAEAGVVICDKVRVVLAGSRAHGVAAPGALPADVADWLERLAAAVEAAGARELAASIRDRLQQFRAG